jgi:hypothetical protein
VKKVKLIRFSQICARCGKVIPKGEYAYKQYVGFKKRGKRVKYYHVSCYEEMTYS